MFKFRTGLPWRDLPARSGPRQTVHSRFARRRRRHIRTPPGPSPEPAGGGPAGHDRLHHRADPPAHRGQRRLEERELGRSRGGPTGKLHLACYGQGRPLAFLLTSGNRNNCTQAETVISRIRVTGPGPGTAPDPARPRRRGQGPPGPYLRGPPPSARQDPSRTSTTARSKASVLFRATCRASPTTRPRPSGRGGGAGDGARCVTVR